MGTHGQMLGWINGSSKTISSSPNTICVADKYLNEINIKQ
jgi:hypothetical protein